MSHLNIALLVALVLFVLLMECPQLIGLPPVNAPFEDPEAPPEFVSQ